MVGCLLICCGVCAFADRKTDERKARTTRALDACEAGQWDDAVALAGADPDFISLLKEFPDTGASWARVTHDGPTQVRRLHAADVLALELANVSMRDGEERQAGRALALATAEDVIKGPVTSFDHAWALALVALLEGPPDQSTQWVQWRTRLQSRFPDDGRFTLAAVTNRREARLIQGHPADHPELVVHPDELKRTLRDLTGLEARPDVRAEAALRRGVLQFETGDLPGALADLAIAADARNSGDPFTRGLAHLVEARALDLMSRHDAALEEYERAVDALPDAQSAQIARALATMDSPRRLETAASLDRALGVTPPVPDPWHEYGHGEYRHWPDAIAALRALAAQ